MNDIPATVLLFLRTPFFNADGNPVAVKLGPKATPQDDPSDEHLANDVFAAISDISCVKAPRPLITPDVAPSYPDLHRRESRHRLREDLRRLVAFEVKKLERTPEGSVARASWLDYSATPPYGRVRVCDDAGNASMLTASTSSFAWSPRGPGSRERRLQSLPPSGRRCSRSKSRMSKLVAEKEERESAMSICIPNIQGTAYDDFLNEFIDFLNSTNDIKFQATAVAAIAKFLMISHEHDAGPRWLGEAKPLLTGTIINDQSADKICDDLVKRAKKSKKRGLFG